MRLPSKEEILSSSLSRCVFLLLTTSQFPLSTAVPGSSFLFAMDRAVCVHVILSGAPERFYAQDEIWPLSAQWCPIAVCVVTRKA